jgi:hypothetical protein
MAPSAGRRAELKAHHALFSHDRLRESLAPADVGWRRSVTAQISIWGFGLARFLVGRLSETSPTRGFQKNG